MEVFKWLFYSLEIGAQPLYPSEHFQLEFDCAVGECPENLKWCFENLPLEDDKTISLQLLLQNRHATVKDCQWLHNICEIGLNGWDLKLALIQKVDVAKWMLSLFPTETPSEEAFNCLCKITGDVEFVEWLINEKNCTPTAESFAWACSTSAKEHESDIIHSMVKALLWNNTEVANWLEDTFHVMQSIDTNTEIAGNSLKEICEGALLVPLPNTAAFVLESFPQFDPHIDQSQFQEIILAFMKSNLPALQRLSQLVCEMARTCSECNGLGLAEDQSLDIVGWKLLVRHYPTIDAAMIRSHFIPMISQSPHVAIHTIHSFGITLTEFHAFLKTQSVDESSSSWHVLEVARLVSEMVVKPGWLDDDHKSKYEHWRHDLDLFRVGEAMFPLVGVVCSRATALCRTRNMSRYSAITSAASVPAPRCVAWLVNNREARRRGGNHSSNNDDVIGMGYSKATAAQPTATIRSHSGGTTRDCCEVVVVEQQRRDWGESLSAVKEVVAALMGLCIGGHLSMAKAMLGFGASDGGQCLWDGWGVVGWGLLDKEVRTTLRERVIEHVRADCGNFYLMYRVCVGGNLDVVKWLVGDVIGVGEHRHETTLYLELHYYATVQTCTVSVLRLLHDADACLCCVHWASIMHCVSQLISQLHSNPAGFKLACQLFCALSSILVITIPKSLIQLQEIRNDVQNFVEVVLIPLRWNWIRRDA
ncbi:hypothetical protein Pelo_4231 [Pelomyxa schiedti]|nr:hypothetical protein Pelo_4231 [Pelomyxa schiedti]